MLHINTAARIINEAKPVDAYWQGFQNFIDGQTLEEQPTWNHKNGWRWALDRQSQCEYMPAKSSVNWSAL